MLSDYKDITPKFHNDFSLLIDETKVSHPDYFLAQQFNYYVSKVWTLISNVKNEIFQNLIQLRDTDKLKYLERLTSEISLGKERLEKRLDKKIFVSITGKKYHTNQITWEELLQIGDEIYRNWSRFLNSYRGSGEKLYSNFVNDLLENNEDDANNIDYYNTKIVWFGLVEIDDYIEKMKLIENIDPKSQPPQQPYYDSKSHHLADHLLVIKLLQIVDLFPKKSPFVYEKDFYQFLESIIGPGDFKKKWIKAEEILNKKNLTAGEAKDAVNRLGKVRKIFKSLLFSEDNLNIIHRTIDERINYLSSILK